MQTPSTDLRPERFTELQVGSRRIARRGELVLFVGLGGVVVGSILFKDTLPSPHWIWGAFSAGTIAFVLGVGVYLFLAQRQLALKLNVFCRTCRRPPIPGHFRRAVSSRSCPRCGREYEIEQGAAPNGGPATQLGNSGVTEGPPSLS